MSPGHSSPEITEFVTFLAKERNDSPHTVKAYERDLTEFAAFCENYYGGPWTWAGVDRLAGPAPPPVAASTSSRWR